MRVLHVISGLDPRQGGPTAALCALSEAQHHAGMDVSVLATWRNEAEVIMAERLRARGIPVRLVGPVRGWLSGHRDLPAAVSGAVRRADVVHVHALWEEIQHLAATAAHTRGVPYVIRPCGMLDPWSLHRHPLRKMAYMFWRLRRDLHRAGAIHFTSGGECESATGLGLRAPVIVEPLGLDLREFDHEPGDGARGEGDGGREFRRRWPGLADRPYAIFFGRLSQGKGLDLLLPAFARARRGRAALVIAGPDPANVRPELERRARALRIDRDVFFTGMLEGAQRVAALAGAELFVLPSRHENFGLAVAEAMAAGRPVIVSDRVNIHPEIRRAEAGAVVPLDVGALATALTAWLGDPGLRAAAGARARDFVREHYDVSRVARGWADHYDHLVRCRRGARRNRFEPARVGDVELA